nr:RNA-directed DNA polymerase, eukaryota, reverse transcriptase zinc-binding domain protein [Tanacetum cinerariifolium]
TEDVRVDNFWDNMMSGCIDNIEGNASLESLVKDNVDQGNYEENVTYLRVIHKAINNKFDKTCTKHCTINKIVMNNYANKLDSSQEKMDNKLCHIPNVIKENGQEYVIFDEEIVKDGSEKWELAACRYFVGPQKRQWNVGKKIVESMKVTANKYSVLQNLDDEIEHNKLKDEDKKKVDRYVMMKQHPPLHETSTWTREMINYFKYTWEICNASKVRINPNESDIELDENDVCENNCVSSRFMTDNEVHGPSNNMFSQ